MEIIFYNITAIVVGCFLIYYGLYSLIKKNKFVFGIASLVIAIIIIGFGIWGFFLGDYQFLVILALLAFVLIEIIFFVLFNKKETVKRNGNKNDFKPKKVEKESIENENDQQ